MNTENQGEHNLLHLFQDFGQFKLHRSDIFVARNVVAG